MPEQITNHLPAMRADYIANGTMVSFPFTFPLLSDQDAILVWIDGNPRLAGFSIRRSGREGGQVDFSEPPAAGARLTLMPRLRIGRTTSFDDSSPFRAQNLNGELDAQIALLQQADADLGRAVKRAPASQATADLTLPEPDGGKLLGWRADGGALENKTTTEGVAVVSPAMNGVLAAATVAGARALLGPEPATNVSVTAPGQGAVVRNVADRLNETISVADFGAIGDGVADATAAFNAALAARSAGGGIVTVPPGIYRVNITLPDYVRLEGLAGPMKVRLRPWNNAKPVIEFGGVRSELVNLDINGYGAGVSAIGLRATQRSGNALRGINVEGFTDGVVLNAAIYWTVEDFAFRNCGTCLRLTNSSNANNFRMGRIVGFDTGILIDANPSDYTATTIGFTAPATIADSASNLVAAGFQVGQFITVTGSAGNSGSSVQARYQIAALSAGSITLAEGSNLLVTEAAGTAIRLFTDISHGNLFDSIIIEGPNARGVGVLDWNGGENTFTKAYFEGFYAANASPALVKGTPVDAWHNGDANSASLVDKSGRDFVKMGLKPGDTVKNITDNSTATITAIATTVLSNDTIHCTLTAGTRNKFDPSDWVRITPATLPANPAGRTMFISPSAPSQGEVNRLVAGLNCQPKIIGRWAGRKTGEPRFGKLSNAALSAWAPVVIDLSPNLSAWTSRYALYAKVDLRVTVTGGGGTFYVFPEGGSSAIASSENYWADFKYTAAQEFTLPGLVVPIYPSGKFSLMSATATTVTLFVKEVYSL